MKQNNRIFLAIFIIFLGTILRVFLNKVIAIPNFEAITSLSLLSGSFLGGFFAVLVPLFMIFLSDIFFGNSAVYVFTWSAFILIGAFGILFKRKSKHFIPKITVGGVLSVLFFYFWTNFGWWLVSGMYLMNFQGLIQSYIAGLPFLKNQLFSVLIFTPVFAVSFSWIFDKILIREAKKYENFTFTSKNS